MEKERYGDECKCEYCDYEPLKHFEKCPICGSQSYHITVNAVELNQEEVRKEPWRIR